MAILRIKDESGNIISIPSIKGDKGDPGEKGDKGDTGAKGDKGDSGVYIGSGDMPDGCNIKIDPEGEADEFVTKQEFNNALGDIDKALDAIIEIQESILGG